jgi:predicted TIM-barrel enzyme
MDLAWWIAVVGVPLVGAIFTVDGIIHAKAAANAGRCHARIDNVSKELADYKVTAAMLFAQVALVREVKDDLIKVLDRIDQRLGAIEDDLRGEHRKPR